MGLLLLMRGGISSIQDQQGSAALNVRYTAMNGEGSRGATTHVKGMTSLNHLVRP
jgi:hypothetical protein